MAAVSAVTVVVAVVIVVVLVTIIVDEEDKMTTLQISVTISYLQLMQRIVLLLSGDWNISSMYINNHWMSLWT